MRQPPNAAEDAKCHFHLVVGLWLWLSKFQSSVAVHILKDTVITLLEDVMCHL